MFGGKKLTPQERAKQWKTTIRSERRAINRQMLKIEREEDKIKQKVKLLMKQGHQDSVMPLIAEIANSKKTRSKLLKTCTQLDSMVRQIDLQMAQVKVCGTFQKSAEVTRMMNQMVKVPEMQRTMMQLQQEMEKSGLTEEMLDETMDELNGDTEAEDQELAVRLVYNEIAKDVSKTTGKPIEQIPIDQEEIEENPDLVKMAAL
ncbi:charged multivesicular body protein 3 [Histomonas meleagridis]|uniref:charged multivesicular body protein 3 n=1 Tax=Histomonas meleagridis TaxID=135588 RepID=UPI00355A9730|nr:charged multivesicular body protein 3 [Histomonas meleagridis]KAH0806863.1 charged multivesicular body protein 3 [Histomonas meleagridis]